jgi:hypothetical protein
MPHADNEALDGEALDGRMVRHMTGGRWGVGRRGAGFDAVPSGVVPTRQRICRGGWVKTLGESNIYDFGSVEGAVRSTGGVPRGRRLAHG